MLLESANFNRVLGRRRRLDRHAGKLSGAMLGGQSMSALGNAAPQRLFNSRMSGLGRYCRVTFARFPTADFGCNVEKQ
ncbi:MAG: hypothetical protein ABJF86_11840 [Tateyamaria sp.]|uniref:hypothetical protein n=1 Tax=Roseobacteraceae TaxID=2854170 RepID=UPI003285E699